MGKIYLQWWWNWIRKWSKLKLYFPGWWWLFGWFGRPLRFGIQFGRGRCPPSIRGSEVSTIEIVREWVANTWPIFPIIPCNNFLWLLFGNFKIFKEEKPQKAEFLTSIMLDVKQKTKSLKTTNIFLHIYPEFIKVNYIPYFRE